MYRPFSSFPTAAASRALPALLVLVAASWLAGCAAPAASAGKGTAGAPAVAASPAPAPVVAPPPAPAVPDVSANGTITIEFEKNGTMLGDDARSLLARVADRARAAQRINITGYSDRTQTGNAREIAVARATTVRNEMVRSGVPAAKVRVKYVTSEARQAVEIALEEGRARR